MTKQNPVTVKAGKLEFIKINAERTDFRDIYNWLLTLTWPRFFAILLLAFLGLNFFFATLYAIGGQCIDSMPNGSIEDGFYFSVETLATVGYGHMYPATRYGHLVATFEIMTGMFGTALMTGIIFVRFSRPVAKIKFSKTIVIGPFDNAPCLMFRVANMRHHSMAEAEFRLMLIRNEKIAEGEIRRFHPLKLQFDRLIAFPAVLTVRHIIDKESPIFGQSLEQIQASDTLFVTSVVCIDTAIPASVQSQYQYSARDIRYNHRFIEIYRELSSTQFEVDYGRIHETEPIEAQS